ncbi:hypothetical protein LMG7974_00494 [Campylobacter majalis]|uniref:Cysteine permease n=2 Tax=Campylobacter majalis TaxID=2790656 RepID=A0ABN7K599_9BACT|nr:hypothetical protein LMG7974_00494 [Campylobacter majalis]
MHMKFTLSANQCLDDYVLNAQFCELADISSNAYQFWRDVVSSRYENSRSVFLLKKTIPKKYQMIVDKCTDLSGYVLSSAFCSFTGLAHSHLTSSNPSQFYKLVDVMMINGIKLVNLKKFYDDFGLDYDLQIYIEKCKYFSPTPFEKRIRLTPTLCLGYY